MANPNRILTTTQDKLLAKVVDTVLGSNVLMDKVMSSPKRWEGEQLKVPFKHSKNTQVSSYSGMDTLSTSQVDTRDRLTFDLKHVDAPVVLALTELTLNSGSQKVIDLMGVEMESTAQDMADAIGDMLYGDGTGNSGKDIQGLGAIVDDGTSVATYGGQARSTYTGLKATVTASGGALTLDKMATLWNNCTTGKVKPTLGVTTETVWSLYEQLLTPQERIMKDVGATAGLVGGTGYTGLSYKGIPIIADEKCDSGTLFFLNEKFLHWYAKPLETYKPIKFSRGVIEGNDYESMTSYGFTASDWIPSQTQKGLVKRLDLSGEFLSDNPRSMGKLTGITSV